MLVMLIRYQMDVMRAMCFAFLALLLFVPVASSTDHGKMGEEMFLSRLVDPSTEEIDGNMAEFLWISCRQEMTVLIKAFEDPALLCLSEEMGNCPGVSKTKSDPLSKGIIRKLMDVLQPQLKQILLSCIREKNLLDLVSGQESHSKLWYAEYFESLYHRREYLRRNLADQSIADVPSSSPFSAPAPAPGPAILLPLGQPPASPPKSSFFPPQDSSAGAPVDNSGSSDSSSNAQAAKEDNKHKIIVAVVVTAVVTFIAAALFFLCCFARSKHKHTDQKPLLSLSMSDYSGSSHGFHAFGNSIEEEKLGHQTYGNQSLGNGNSSMGNNVHVESLASAAKSSTEYISYNMNGPLPPPPGRVAPSPPRFPPLKTPPGRAAPLANEPLAPMRTGPHPPRPPVHPPSQMNSAVSAGPRPPVPPPPAMNSSAVSAAPRPPGPPPPPIPASSKPGPPPPPPAGGGPPPPRPPPSLAGPKGPRPPIPRHSASAKEEEAGSSKAKLKPFFWEKVNANPEHSMVWNQIKSGSFQFNEDMIETLFGTANTDKNKNEKKSSASFENVPQFVQILDPKKAYNLSILLKASNVTTEEICDALREGNELPLDVIQNFLKMAPTADEELKLRLYSGDLSLLGPAERYLKTLVDIPFSFKRMETLLFMCTLNDEMVAVRESFRTLEVACKELRSSRLFLKLLEAVLKTGNRMNDGTYRGGAQAFKLDTLLKLADVKGIDGKTTLLHFVVQEIIRAEGVRAARVIRESNSVDTVKTEDLLQEVTEETEDHYRNLGLQVVSGLSGELEHVKNAAVIDADSITATVSRLGHELVKARNFLNSEMKNSKEESGFHESLKSFVQISENEVKLLLEEEKKIMSLVKSTGDYFHGHSGKDEGLHLFAIVRDFLIMLDKVCKEVRMTPRKPAKAQKTEVPSASNASSPPKSRFAPSPDPHQKLAHAIAERRMNDSAYSSGSDDDT